ncbi:hypothetical protein F4678DRAFT_477656 [Xylaria arbuscula]|nr:hypothetical protein F4678DRAFT_477656 [Xylaria arbuscula]
MFQVPRRQRERSLWHKLRLKNFNRLTAYRRGEQVSDENAYQQLPLRGRPPPPDDPVPGPRPAYPVTLASRDRFQIDMYTDEAFVPDEFKVSWRRCQTLKEHFALEYPTLRYNKCLGWGGNGMATVFDDLDNRGNKVRSVVVKMLISDDPEFMEIETKHLVRKYQTAEHILQILFEPSREDDELSGIMGGNWAGPLGRGNRKRRPRPSQGGRSAKRTAPGRPKLNCFITEMVENGDLAHFLAKFIYTNEGIPNPILWRFLLCLVRMCIGLAYPPMSIDELKNRPAPITEVRPEDENVSPKRLVHFDLDPRNIFLGNLDVGDEHDLTPLLKLGDFGMAVEVEPEKENLYYEKLRHYGKTGYLAPEQFCTDWDYIDADNGLIHLHPIAGNYGIHTNLWAVMECLITRCLPPYPPQPTLITTDERLGRPYHTYAGRLMNREYSYVDRDLIYVVARLQAHDPADRLTLEELNIDTAIAEKGNYGMTNVQIRQWMSRVLYDAPLPEPVPEPGPMEGVQYVGAEVIGAPPLNPVPQYQFNPMGQQFQGFRGGGEPEPPNMRPRNRWRGPGHVYNNGRPAPPAPPGGFPGGFPGGPLRPPGYGQWGTVM